MRNYFIFFYLIILGCSSDESQELPINGAPSDFEVTVMSSIYNNSVITWSQSFDPEGKDIRYTVYLEGDQVGTELEERTFNFQELVPSTRYEGKVVASDSDGNQTIKDFFVITEGNLSPSEFFIEFLETDNVSANITWTKSIDPEEKDVHYNIYIDNELIVSDLESEYYTVVNLQANEKYDARIIAFDPEGNERALDFEIATADGIYQGDLNLGSQNGVDFFGAKGYKEITGNLEIDSNDIIDLSPLKDLKIVGGYFTIHFNRELKNLSGLQIEIVRKSFRIKNNYALESLEGLEYLKEIDGDFEISGNSILNRLTSFNDLKIIAGSLIVKGNIKLESLTGFDYLTKVDNIFISNNIISYIDTFYQVTEIERDFTVNTSEALTSLKGLESLERVGRLFIEDTGLTNIDAFSSLQVAESEVNIDNNKNLTNILGLNSLTTITYGSLNIYRNPELISLDGLEKLTAIGYTVEIAINRSLADFCALQNAMQNFVPSANPNIHSNYFNPSIEDIKNGNCK
ncbi:hypothetical protein [uncultured Aquimarina sp.]|uniref:fibronectin type III domain-containing protein n=1 Tax=uncultured Aquimarina sp. TaxID=575652 RepID=UPI002638C05A|nr:hypothetical protein [uncultured Aquimarina sp.]